MAEMSYDLRISDAHGFFVSFDGHGFENFTDIEEHFAAQSTYLATIKVTVDVRRETNIRMAEAYLSRILMRLWWATMDRKITHCKLEMFYWGYAAHLAEALSTLSLVESIQLGCSDYKSPFRVTNDMMSEERDAVGYLLKIWLSSCHGTIRSLAIYPFFSLDETLASVLDRCYRLSRLTVSKIFSIACTRDGPKEDYVKFYHIEEVVLDGAGGAFADEDLNLMRHLVCIFPRVKTVEIISHPWTLHDHLLMSLFTVRDATFIFKTSFEDMGEFRRHVQEMFCEGQLRILERRCGRIDVYLKESRVLVKCLPAA